MLDRLPLHVLAPGLAIAAALLGALRALGDLWRALDGGLGFGSSFTFWAPLLFGLFGLLLVVVLAATAVLGLLRPSPTVHVAAAVVAGAAAGFFGPSVIQQVVVLFADAGVGAFLSLLWGALVTVVVVAAAVAAGARAVQLVRGGGPSAGGSSAEPSAGAWGSGPGGESRTAPAWGVPPS